MNKKLYFPALATLLMLAGCTADEQDEASGLVPLSLSAEIQAEEVTRAGTSLLNSFSDGDALGINLTNCINSSGEALATTTYTVGTGFALQPYISVGQTATVTGYYPSSAASATSFSVQPDQTTDANYKASDLMFAAAQSATKTSPSPTLTFAHKMAKLIVNVTTASGVSNITSVTLNNISRTVGWTASTGTLGDLSSSGDITMSNGGAALIPPQTTSESNNFLTIVTNAGTATYKLGKEFAGGSVYTININVGLANINASTTITGWTGNESSIEVNPTTIIETKLEAVDIGMHVGGNSSGAVLKWANMNVGASSETDYGDYYMWAGVAGYGGANSSGTATDGFSFSWANCPYNGGNTSFNASKYTSSDNNTTLEAMDDAATIHFGSPWRMPTQAELQELYNTFNTNASATDKTHLWEWKDDYKSSGHAGYLITCKSNGHTLFLPAAGFRYDTDVLGQGEFGGYWSSSLLEGYPFSAWLLYFGSDDASVYGNIRYHGYTVRAVQSN